MLIAEGADLLRHEHLDQAFFLVSRNNREAVCWCEGLFHFAVFGTAKVTIESPKTQVTTLKRKNQHQNQKPKYAKDDTSVGPVGKGGRVGVRPFRGKEMIVRFHVGFHANAFPQYIVGVGWWVRCHHVTGQVAARRARQSSQTS